MKNSKYSLNAETAKVLLSLAEQARAKDNYLKLNNSNVYTPLTVEIIEEREEGYLVSFAHYGEMNGDLMRDPEMCFAVRNDGIILPYNYRNDYMLDGEWCLCQTSIQEETLFSDKIKVVKTLHFGFLDFASEWMKNIVEQQGLRF